MKILFLTSGKENAPSPRIRVLQYLPHLRQRGFECKVISYNLKHYFKPFPTERIKKLIVIAYRKFTSLYYHLFQTIRFVVLACFYDIIFIQRVLLPVFIQKLIKIFNSRIIFDFNDAIFIFRGKRVKKWRPKHHQLKIKHILKISKLIIVENRYNREFAVKYNSNVEIITGPIDTDRYFPKLNKSSGEVVLGWIGSYSTTKYLRIIENPLKLLSLRYPNLVLELIGAEDIIIEGVKVKIKRWSLDSEVSNLQNFDIGIMPLPDDNWTRGKGGYKLLQYCAIGIPCVASPVGINKEIVREGINGFLAKDEKEWVEKLVLLIKDKELRERLGRKAREIAVKEYSFYCATPKLVKIFQEVEGIK